jgi:hypothetical protein
VTEPELKADRRKRRRFSAIVTTLSVLIGVSLYLGITNAIQQDSNTGRIGKLERPTAPELADRLKLGIEECLKRPECLPVLAKVNRAGRAHPTRRNGGATRTSPSRHGGDTVPGQGNSNGGPNGGSTGGPNRAPPSQPTPTPRPAPSHQTPTPTPRPHVELPPPLPAVPLPTHLPLPAACVPGPLHICVQP